jgi:FkbM family methyltransferase
MGAIGLEVRRLRPRRMRANISETLGHLVSLGFEPATVIDVGVGHGTFDLYERFPRADHLLVEPLEEFRPVLEEVARKYRATYILAAAGARNGMAQIGVHSYLEGSSLLPEKGRHDDVVMRTVPVVTLDGVCKERGLRGPYLLKVDVQGAELEVVAGASEVLSETEAAILEVSLFQFAVDGPQFADIVDAMSERGFVVYDIVGGHTRPLDGALAQVDLTFVKEAGRFRRSHLYDPPSE